jgi:hypothetical protein
MEDDVKGYGVSQACYSVASLVFEKSGIAVDTQAGAVVMISRQATIEGDELAIETQVGSAVFAGNGDGSVSILGGDDSPGFVFDQADPRLAALKNPDQHQANQYSDAPFRMAWAAHNGTLFSTAFELLRGGANQRDINEQRAIG